MYTRFLSHNNLPAGAVLGHILKQQDMTQRQLSAATGILPQRINDYISGKRRISAEASLLLEQALSIKTKGFFYIIQANHDIHDAITLHSEDAIPDLTRIKKSIFWDTDISRLNWNSNRKSIIRRVFEYGDEQAIKEIIRFYGKNEVTDILTAITDPHLHQRRLANMQKYLYEDETDIISLKGGYWEFVADDIEHEALKIMHP